VRGSDLAFTATLSQSCALPMTPMSRILRARDEAARCRASALAAEALSRLREKGFGAWVVGSLANGLFRQHSDIDLVLDAPSHRRDEAIRVAFAPASRRACTANRLSVGDPPGGARILNILACGVDAGGAVWARKGWPSSRRESGQATGTCGREPNCAMGRGPKRFLTP